MRAELSRTIVSLQGSIMMEKECRRDDFCQSIEDDDPIFCFEESDILGNFMTHLKSEFVRVLRLAMNLLREACERISLTVFHLVVMDESK